MVSSASIGLLAALTMEGIAMAGTEFTIVKSGKFYHNLSTLGHGYDLVADTLRLASESDDLKDFLATETGGFNGKWKAGNTTTYVNAPPYPYFNAQTGSADFTFAKIDSLYKAGTPISVQNSPGTGSYHVYLAKLRGGGSYAIVKFTTRIGTNNDCNCANPGVATFDYWKMPSGATAVKPLLAADRKRPIRLKVSDGRLVIDRKAKTSGDMIRLNLLGQIAVPGFDQK